jgi:ribosome-associated heat shock protein Hsp15
MSAGPEAAGDALRIDRWLWCVRFFKTRSIAAAAVKGGHVKVNGRRTKAAHDVKVGDALEIIKAEQRFDVCVERIPARRGSATEAQRCYTETPESIERRREQAARRRREPLPAPPTPGRPDKRTRRLLRRQQRDEDR